MIIAILYLESPVVLIHGIGIGQIDVLGVLFFLLSIRFWLEKNYYKMASTMVYVCVADASFDGRGGTQGRGIYLLLHRKLFGIYII